MNIRSKDLFLSLVMAATVSTTAFAHTGSDIAAGFGAGLFHPLTGLDHLLLAVAIGLWAGLRHGHVVWSAPAAITAAMVLLAAGCLGLFHGYVFGGDAMAGAFPLAGLIVATAAILIATTGLGLAVRLQRTAPVVVLGFTLVGLLTL